MYKNCSLSKGNFKKLKYAGGPSPRKRGMHELFLPILFIPILLLKIPKVSNNLRNSS
jgi:hypothetical protein